MTRKKEFNITQTSFKDAAEMFLKLYLDLKKEREKDNYENSELYEKQERLRAEYLDTIDRMIETKLSGFNADIDKNGIFTIQSLYAATAKKLIDDIDNADWDYIELWECYFHFLAGMHNVVKYLDDTEKD